jgi:hypothetical protein
MTLRKRLAELERRTGAETLPHCVFFAHLETEAEAIARYRAQHKREPPRVVGIEIVAVGPKPKQEQKP